MSKEPRIVTITKEAQEEFEFFLRKNSDGSQYLTRITEGGPADRAGAKNEDKLIEVNGVNVEKKSHEEVVTMIKASVPENAVTFKLVYSGAESQSNAQASTSNSPTTSSKSNPPEYSDLDLRPRICKIEKRRNTFGFFLMQGKHSADETPGHFIKEIVELGAAVDSGLKVGDRVIAVGKTNVESFSHSKVVSLIKESGNKVTLLVVDVPTYNHYKKRGKKITAHDAISSSDSVVSNSSSTRSSVKSGPPASSASKKGGHPRQVHLIKDTKDGFGFYLRCKLLQKEPLMTEEYIGDLEKGKSGDLCGLKESDIILSVNGNCIEEKSHEAVVNMIKSNPVHSVFIVIPSEMKSTFNKASSAGKVEKLLREKPKRVELRRSPGGYGFTIKYSQDATRRHIFHDIEDGTPAQACGIKNNEVLLAVNDSWVMHETHESAVGKIRASGDAVKLTVSSDSETCSILSKLSLGSVDDFFAKWPKEDDLKYPYDDTETGEREYAQVHKPRFCHLVKGEQGYGFFLRGDEDGIHVLDRIEEGGPAEKAGVKNGDLVIEINGENVESCDHDKAVEKIRSHSDHVDFLVVDEASKSYFKSKGIVISAALLSAEKKEEVAEPAEVAPEPRFCRLVKDYSQSFEFHLNSEPKSERPGQYIRRVTEGGIAAVAGLKNGDRVICINGENIEEKSHEDVVSMIRGSGNEVTFLVVDDEADNYYKGKGIKITAALIKANAVLQEEDDEPTSTSVVEAEATVHDEPKAAQDVEEDVPSAEEEVIDSVTEEIKETEEQPADPVIDFPGPPADEPDSVAEALEEIQEAVNDEETPAEEIKEAVIDVAEAAIAANIADTITDAVEDASEDEVKEEIKEEIAEAIVEAVAEDKVEDVAEDIKEEIAEEIAEAVAEDVKEEIVEDIKEDIVEDIKENVEEIAEDSAKPPSTFLDAIISGQQLKATPVPEEAPKKEYPNGLGVTKDDIVNATLKPVEKPVEEVKPVENGIDDIHDPPPKPKFNVRSARAMFENPDSAPVKRNWTRQPSKVNSTAANGQVKNPPTRKLFTQTSAMKFNIVESSASFR